MRKFVARNRAAVSAAAAVVISLAVGTVVSLSQANEAMRQRDAAVRQQQRAEAYSNFLSVLLQDGGSGTERLTTTQLLDRGVAMLDRRSALDDSVSAYMSYELSRNYLLFQNYASELSLLDRSVAAATRIGDASLLAASQCSAAWTMGESDVKAGRARFAAAKAALDSTEVPAEYAVRDCLRAEARLLHLEGDTDGAIRVIERGRAAALGPRSKTAGWRSDLLSTQLSDLYRASDRFAEALALSEETLKTVRADGRAGSLAELVALNNHAGNLCRLGEFLKCAEVQAQTRKWLEGSDVARLPPVGLQANIGTTLWRLGDSAQALALAQADIRSSEAAGNKAASAIGHLLESRALLALGRRDEARRSIEMADALWNTNPTAFRRMIQESKLQHAEIELANGELAAASVHGAELLTAAGYPGKKTAPGLDRILRFAARVSLGSGDAEGARQLAQDAYELSRRVARDPRASADVGGAALLRAQALKALGREPEARGDIELASVALAAGVGENHPDTVAAREVMARLDVTTLF